MAKRITMKMLETWATMINKKAGTPQTYCTKDENGIKEIHVDHYFIEKSPYGVQLVQVSGNGGATRDVLGCHSVKPSELYKLLIAYWHGLCDGVQVTL